MGVAAGCSITDTAGDMRGIKGMDGEKLTHINTRNYAIHLFMIKPMIGRRVTEHDSGECCR